MNDREQLSALIGDIYDAALDPAQRTDVIEKIASFTGGHSGGLLSKHSLGHSENLLSGQIPRACRPIRRAIRNSIRQRRRIPSASRRS
jgi:hypothetical protein